MDALSNGLAGVESKRFVMRSGGRTREEQLTIAAC